MLEGRRAEIQRPKGALVTRVLVHDPANDHMARVAAVDDPDTAAAEGVAPGLRAHHAGGQGHHGLLVPVPVVVTGTVMVIELEEVVLDFRGDVWLGELHCNVNDQEAESENMSLFLLTQAALPRWVTEVEKGPWRQCRFQSRLQYPRSCLCEE